MPNNTNEWEKFNKDPRTKCKYGEKCYQRNPEHHKSYKHPPHSTKAFKDTREKRRFSPFTRKPRNEDTKAQGPDPSEEDKSTQETTLTTDQSPARTEDRANHSTSSATDNNLDATDYNVNLPEDIKYYDKDVEQKVFKDLFLSEMPSDFYKFYECLNRDNAIEKLLSSVNLQLIGPYDLLLGKLPILEDKDLYLVHWRFFYDPPEFQVRVLFLVYF